MLAGDLVEALAVVEIEASSGGRGRISLWTAVSSSSASIEEAQLRRRTGFRRTGPPAQKEKRADTPLLPAPT